MFWHLPKFICILIIRIVRIVKIIIAKKCSKNIFTISSYNLLYINKHIINY